MAHGSGCGCKIGPGLLADALRDAGAAGSTRTSSSGLDRLDDAAVYRVRDDLAVVASVDFFTPVVDDPATFGRIAATNALSDVYAMGATPTFALAVAAFPKEADQALLADILRGGAEAAAAAGCPVLGGHTVDDPEPKYGLAVVGTVAPGPGHDERRGPPRRRARADQAARHRRGGRRAPGRRGAARPARRRRSADAPLERPAAEAALEVGRALRDRRHRFRAAGPPARSWSPPAGWAP